MNAMFLQIITSALILIVKRNNAYTFVDHEGFAYLKPSIYQSNAYFDHAVAGNELVDATVDLAGAEPLLDDKSYYYPSGEPEISYGPGYSFGVAPGVLPELAHSYAGFDYRMEYSPKLANIYKKYLKRPSTPESKLYSNEKCKSAEKELPGGYYGHYYHPAHYELDIDTGDIKTAFHLAGKKIEDYERANQQYLASDPRGLNFSAYVYVATLHSKYNEIVTKIIKNKKCLSRKMLATDMPNVKIPANPWKKAKYCEMQSPVSLTSYCQPEMPYRRIDGKCNNPIYTNLGSQFHCHRRLLPPDYADGIHKIRLAMDNRPLPSPRLVTQILMPELDLNDPTLSALHFAWGQFLVHDTFRTIQNLGLAIDCCRLVNPPKNQQKQQSAKHKTLSRTFLDPAGNKIPIPHPECLPITNFIPSKTTQLLNQVCLNTVRSVACNTCSLGPRNQMNAATQVIDLSHIYGGNILNNSHTLRSYIGGQMLTDFAKNGEIRLTAIRSQAEADNLDLTPCNPPLHNPSVGCFRTGDGIRGNQNPFIASLTTMAVKRHNHHAAGLHLVNPHWDDERLFQEARRLLIAEVTNIHYGEYLPLILGPRLMKYFHLQVRKKGFTKYNPHVDPSTIHAAGVGALRIGHSQTRSIYKVIYDHHYDNMKTTFMLKDRFFNMLEVWKGHITPIVRGLLSEPSKNIDPYGIIDVKDFLFFNPRRPAVIDLFSINVNRGRDHGVPAYIYLLEYCTGYEINSWKDLEKFIPPTKIKTLKKVYGHYRDIDLFVGGLLEYHLKDAKVGPTYACLVGIQFYHWKYGDRFYFEHGGQIGSFTPEQLNEIRKTSLAALICQTTNVEHVQLNPLLEVNLHNPLVPCSQTPSLNYELWREVYSHKK